MAASALRFVLIVVAVSAAVHSQDSNRFSGHIKKVSQFKCSKPQPRSFSSWDVLSKYVPISPGAHITPLMTVIPQCDGGTGCCLQGDDYICAPSKYAKMDLTFKIMDGFTHEVKVVTVEVDAHAKCSCQKLENLGLQNF